MQRWEVETGGGGQHYYFAVPENIGAFPSDLANGVEIKTSGGYVVAPPSVHKSGGVYSWKAGRSPDDVEMAAAPDWLRNFAVTAPEPSAVPVGTDHNIPIEYATAGLDKLCSELRTAPEGKRNKTLFDSALKAGRFVYTGALDETEVLEALVGAAMNAGLSQKEATGTAERGVRLGARPGVQYTEIDRPSAEAELAEPANDNEPSRGRYKFYSIEEVQSFPKPEWLINGLLPKGGFGVLYGEAGGGKTFVALDWALSLATGRSWLSHKPKNISVAYIYAEGHTGLNKRLQAWTLKHDTLDDAPIAFMPQAADFMDRKKVADLVLAIQQSKVDSPELIVIDTLHRNFPGGDENSSKDMGLFIAHCDQLREAFPGATVLIIHHTGKNGSLGMRGSSALNGAADCVFKLVGGGVVKTLKCEKQKDAEPFDDILLSLKQVALGYTNDDGEEETSCVIRDASNFAVPDELLSPGGGGNENDRSCFEALKEGSPSGLTRSEWQVASMAKGVKKGTFKNSVERLVKKAERVSKGEDGLYRVKESG